MILLNSTKKRIIVRNIVIIEDSFRKFIGLMFSKPSSLVKQNKALIFKFNKEKLISLHMFFVFYPIDVLFLDKNKNVVDIKENFKPFTLYKSNKKAMYAVELPKGSIRKTNTCIGDKIDF
ncbi:DUF192 domain-containing protein [Candidatus Woesearchaeota archaeon]|nr:DUF192 domain-containing protein [Candidatus Woesearchaeota archaeon]